MSGIIGGVFLLAISSAFFGAVEQAVRGVVTLWRRCRGIRNESRLSIKKVIRHAR